MGTNFYLGEKHIGKRSAAGAYCWDCRITLCKGGNEKIHYNSSGWYAHCPRCKQEKNEETLENSSAGIELGFNKKGLTRKGVSSICSFSWAMEEKDLWESEEPISDEYGRSVTKEDFLEVLKDCPVQFHEMIGRIFC